MFRIQNFVIRPDNTFEGTITTITAAEAAAVDAAAAAAATPAAAAATSAAAASPAAAAATSAAAAATSAAAAATKRKEEEATAASAAAAAATEEAAKRKKEEAAAKVVAEAAAATAAAAAADAAAKEKTAAEAAAKASANAAAAAAAAEAAVAAARAKRVEEETAAAAAEAKRKETEAAAAAAAATAAAIEAAATAAAATASAKDEFGTVPPKLPKVSVPLPPNVTLRVIFGRHGISCANVIKATGWKSNPKRKFYQDPELSHGGRQQLARLGKLFQAKIEPLHPVVGASVMIRAQQTANGMTNANKIYVIPHISEVGIGLDNTPFPPAKQEEILRSTCEEELIHRLDRQYITKLDHANPNFTKFKAWFGENWFKLSGDTTRPFVFFSHGAYMREIVKTLTKGAIKIPGKNYECHEFAVDVNTTNNTVTDVRYVGRFDYGEGELPDIDPALECGADTCRNPSCMKSSRKGVADRCATFGQEELTNPEWRRVHFRDETVFDKESYEKCTAPTQYDFKNNPNNITNAHISATRILGKIDTMLHGVKFGKTEEELKQPSIFTIVNPIRAPMILLDDMIISFYIDNPIRIAWDQELDSLFSSGTCSIELNATQITKKDIFYSMLNKLPVTNFIKQFLWISPSPRLLYPFFECIKQSTPTDTFTLLSNCKVIITTNDSEKKIDIKIINTVERKEKDTFYLIATYSTSTEHNEFCDYDKEQAAISIEPTSPAGAAAAAKRKEEETAAAAAAAVAKAAAAAKAAAEAAKKAANEANAVTKAAAAEAKRKEEETAAAAAAAAAEAAAAAKAAAAAAKAAAEAKRKEEAAAAAETKRKEEEAAAAAAEAKRKEEEAAAAANAAAEAARKAAANQANIAFKAAAAAAKQKEEEATAAAAAAAAEAAAAAKAAAEAKRKEEEAAEAKRKEEEENEDDEDEENDPELISDAAYQALLEKEQKDPTSISTEERIAMSNKYIANAMKNLKQQQKDREREELYNANRANTNDRSALRKFNQIKRDIEGIIQGKTHEKERLDVDKSSIKNDAEKAKLDIQIETIDKEIKELEKQKEEFEELERDFTINSRINKAEKDSLEKIIKIRRRLVTIYTKLATHTAAEAAATLAKDPTDITAPFHIKSAEKDKKDAELDLKKTLVAAVKAATSETGETQENLKDAVLEVITDKLKESNPDVWEEIYGSKAVATPSPAAEAALVKVWRTTLSMAPPDWLATFGRPVAGTASSRLEEEKAKRRAIKRAHKIEREEYSASLYERDIKSFLPLDDQAEKYLEEELNKLKAAREKHAEKRAQTYAKKIYTQERDATYSRTPVVFPVHPPVEKLLDLMARKYVDEELEKVKEARETLAKYRAQTYAKKIYEQERDATYSRTPVVFPVHPPVESLDPMARRYVDEELEKVKEARERLAKYRAESYQALKSTGPLDDMAKQQLDPSSPKTRSTTRKRKSHHRARSQRTRRA